MLKLYFKKILSKAWRKFIKIKNYVTTENDSLVKSLYQSATNPIFEVFYLQGYYITFKPVENFCIIVIWISVEDMKNVKL